MSKPISEWQKVGIGGTGFALLMEDQFQRPIIVVAHAGEDHAKIRKALTACKQIDTSLVAILDFEGQPPRAEFLPDSAEIKQHRDAVGPIPERITPSHVVDGPAIHAARRQIRRAK